MQTSQDLKAEHTGEKGGIYPPSTHTHTRTHTHTHTHIHTSHTHLTHTPHTHRHTHTHTSHIRTELAMQGIEHSRSVESPRGSQQWNTVTLGRKVSSALPVCHTHINQLISGVAGSLWTLNETIIVLPWQRYHNVLVQTWLSDFSFQAVKTTSNEWSHKRPSHMFAWNLSDAGCFHP